MILLWLFNSALRVRVYKDDKTRGSYGLIIEKQINKKKVKMIFYDFPLRVTIQQTINGGGHWLLSTYKSDFKYFLGVMKFK